MPVHTRDAALTQLADTDFISSDEKVALRGWFRDMGQCRNILPAAVTQQGLYSFLPAILADEDRQDRIYTLLIQKKITWGEAVLRLKASRTGLLESLAATNDRLQAEATQSEQAVRVNQTGLLNALTRLAP
jgi:hypothetical protein